MDSSPSREQRLRAADCPRSVRDLERELIYLARMLEAVQRARPYPLERAHYLLLLELADNPHLTVAGLAAALILDDSTVTRQLAAMTKLGLVEKISNPDDGRSTLVRITDLGRDEMARTREMRLFRLDAFFTAWSESERASFGALLARFNTEILDRLAP